jgi:hypothetical protein
MAASSHRLRAVLRGLFIVVVLAVTLVIAAQVMVGRLFSPDYLQDFLEENLSVEATVGSTQVNLIAGEVVLSNLTLFPKDPRVTSTSVAIQEVRLGVKTWPLFARRLEISSFVISEPVIRMTLDKEGDLSLAEIFRNPEKKDSKNQKKTKVNQGKDGGVLAAEENRWLAKLDEARLENGRLEMLFEKEKLQLRVEGLHLAITDLQFDPEDLATLNTVRMTLAGGARLSDSEEILLVNLDFSGGARGKLFDERTGDFEADVLLDLALAKSSYLNPRVKIVKRVWSYLDQVEKWGISLGGLPDQIAFGRSRRIVGTYRDDQVTLTEPLSLSAGKWEVGLARESWIATGSGQHGIGVEFLAGKRMSETLGGWLTSLPSEAQSLAQNRFIDEEQVLWRVQSSGDLDDPEFEFFSQIPEAKSLIEDLEESLEDEVDRLKKKAGGFLKDLLE